MITIVRIICLSDYHLKGFKKGENMRKSFLLVIFILFGLFVFSEDRNDYVPSEIIIKLKNIKSDYLFEKDEKEIVRTGNDQIDQLNRENRGR